MTSIRLGKMNLWENVPNLAEATGAPPFIFGLARVVKEITNSVLHQLNEGW